MRMRCDSTKRCVGSVNGGLPRQIEAHSSRASSRAPVGSMPMNEQQPAPTNLEIHVLRAELALEPDTDTRAPGGEVTRELCGHWEHEPPCRWPHNNCVAGDGEDSKASE